MLCVAMYCHTMILIYLFEIEWMEHGTHIKYILAHVYTYIINVEYVYSVACRRKHLHRQKLIQDICTSGKSNKTNEKINKKLRKHKA